jgi:hypothetical protein
MDASRARLKGAVVDSGCMGVMRAAASRPALWTLNEVTVPTIAAAMTSLSTCCILLMGALAAAYLRPTPTRAAPKGGLHLEFAPA